MQSLEGVVRSKTSVSDVDAGARALSMLASVAAIMPPIWRGHGESYPIVSPEGESLGRVLPGVGIVLDCDLRALGIHRRIPHVIERTPWMRWVERALRPETWRCAIATYDGIISGRSSDADDQSFSKATFPTVSNTWSSQYQASGFPASGSYTAIPGGASHNKNTTGALSFALTNPGGGLAKYLLTFGFVSSSAVNMLLLGDLLIGAGNILGTTNAAQTVNSTALTRYTSGVGVLMTFDVVVALGGTAANLTVSYTNQAGTAGQTTPAVAMTTSAIVQRLQPTALGPFMQLQTGDMGVKSVQTATLSASMTAGTFALNLFKTLSFVPGVAATIYAERDSTTQIDGLLPLVTEGGGNLGCLVAYIFAGAGTAGTTTGFLRATSG